MKLLSFFCSIDFKLIINLDLGIDTLKVSLMGIQIGEIPNNTHEWSRGKEWLCSLAQKLKHSEGNQTARHGDMSALRPNEWLRYKILYFLLAIKRKNKALNVASKVVWAFKTHKT